MAESFLHLELDIKGIKAKIIEQGDDHTITKKQCHVLFKDLPDIKSESSDNEICFNAGMDMAAQKLDFSSCSKAIIFVSGLLISFRNIELPFNSEKKIKQILPFELENLLLDNTKTYISDFHILDSTDDSNLILSASISEHLVKKYFLKLDENGIKPLIITPTGYAAAIGLLKKSKKLSTFAFLHATDLEITLVLIKERKPCAVRTIANSNISSDRLAIIVKQTINGFNQRTGENNKFDIVVCLDENIHNAAQISNAFETDIGAMSKLGIKIDPDTMLSNIRPDKLSPYLFNFCQGKYGTSSFIKTYFSDIVASAVLLIFILGVIVAGVIFDNNKLEERIAVIDNQALLIFKTSFPDKTKIHDPYLQMKANVQSFMKKSKIQKNVKSFTGNSDLKKVKIIRELSRKIDDSIDIDISRFLFNLGRLVISGSTDNYNNVDKIKSKIESSQIFRTVNISSASADKKNNRIKFKFIIEM